jgi:hypothetical protein
MIMDAKLINTGKQNSKTYQKDNTPQLNWFHSSDARMVQDSKSITAIQHINNKGKKTHDYRN